MYIAYTLKRYEGQIITELVHSRDIPRRVRFTILIPISNIIIYSLPIRILD